MPPRLPQENADPVGRHTGGGEEQAAAPVIRGPSGCHPHSSSAPLGRKEQDLSAHIHSDGGDPG